MKLEMRSWCLISLPPLNCAGVSKKWYELGKIKIIRVWKEGVVIIHKLHIFYVENPKDLQSGIKGDLRKYIGCKANIKYWFFKQLENKTLKDILFITALKVLNIKE